MAKYHLAQVNMGRIKASLDSEVMRGFMSRLDEINALAERSPGFVWRLQTSAGNATYFRPYPEDESILLNMSVWESIETLKQYVYRTMHAEVLRQRHDWFEKFSGVYLALWWVPAGHIPSIDEARKRIAHLNAQARHSSRLISKQPSNRTTNFKEALIGHRSYRVPRCSFASPNAPAGLASDEPRRVHTSVSHT